MASITKRTGARGDRYDARLRVNGRTVTRTFKTKKQATEWAHLMEADRVLGVAVDPGAGGIKLKDYGPSWIDSRRLAPRTVELYNDLFTRMILPKLGEAKLGKLSPEQVRRWHKELAATRTELQAAKSYRLLRAMLNTAAADGLIGRNPCAIPGAGQEHSAERPLVTTDTVLDLADTIAPRFRALILLAAFGGLRRGELLGLRRSDIDLTAGTVTVARQVVVLTDGQLTTAPKTRAGLRTVHVPAVVVEALTEHLGTYSGPGTDGAVFTGDKGGPVPVNTLYAAFNKATAALELEGVTLHDLRHAAGTLAAWTGATTRELMARLGHASPRAAMRYQHAAVERDRDIADRLDVLVNSTNRSPKVEPTPLAEVRPRDGARDERAIGAEAG